MRKLFSIFSLVLLYVGITFGQAAVEIPFTVQDSNGNTRTLIFGLDLTATSGIDVALGENEQPHSRPAVHLKLVLFLLQVSHNWVKVH